MNVKKYKSKQELVADLMQNHPEMHKKLMGFIKSVKKEINKN